MRREVCRPRLDCQNGSDHGSQRQSPDPPECHVAARRLCPGRVTLGALRFPPGLVAAQDASPAAAGSQAAESTPLPEGFNARMARQVERVIDSVHPIRGLPSATGVGYRVIDEETFTR